MSNGRLKKGSPAKLKFLITGSRGQLAQAFQSLLRRMNLEYLATSEEELDITEFDRTKQFIVDNNPDIILNCAAYNHVDNAETNLELSMLVNSLSVGNLAEICRENKIFLVHFSSDYVFDGQKGGFYTEEDIPHPINVYGRSKLSGEREIEERRCEYLIFRSSWLFGRGPQNFLSKVYQWAKEKNVLKISRDEISTPTYTEDAASLTLMALEKGLQGLFHLTNNGYASRYDFAQYFLRKMGIPVKILPASSNEFSLPAARPAFSCLSNEKLSKELKISIPSWQEGVDRFIELSRQQHLARFDKEILLKNIHGQH